MFFLRAGQASDYEVFAKTVQRLTFAVWGDLRLIRNYSPQSVAFTLRFVVLAAVIYLYIYG